ncbi:hypothetical protein HCU40_16695 [Pseudanabaena biceps]|nr:hypothetical protein [Pseudanabaena biceps]
MKDIGYYAGFLSQKDQAAITNASRVQALDLIGDLAYGMMADEPTSTLELDDFWLSEHSESEANKLALIRGLCDRIEDKLMEQAKP